MRQKVIYGHISHIEQILASLPVALQTALKHLQATDFSALPVGNYDLQDQDISVQVQNPTTRPIEQTRPEVHRKYIDVHYVCSGRERIGFADDSGRDAVDEDMLAARDLLFYKSVENESFVDLLPGNFAVFFPYDAHRPGCQAGAPETIRKVVMKVATALI